VFAAAQVFLSIYNAKVLPTVNSNKNKGLKLSDLFGIWEKAHSEQPILNKLV
jgi:hypothetical protein